MTKETENKEKERLSKSVVKEISAVAAQVAVALYQEELNKNISSFKDKRFRNTKLLVKKYGLLRDYAENAIYSTAQICAEENNDIFELLGMDLGERHQVGSIRNNVIKTKIIMDHVDTMLDCYKRRCDASTKQEVQRRWRVLQRLYLDREPMNAQDIADIEHISLSMVYQDIDNACEELSPLFFGLDLSTFWM